jgi:hypothetical protein
VIGGEGFERPHRRGIAGEGLGEIGAQCAFSVPPQDALADVLLARDEGAEALLIEIVGQAEPG